MTPNPSALSSNTRLGASIPLAAFSSVSLLLLPLPPLGFLGLDARSRRTLAARASTSGASDAGVRAAVGCAAGAGAGEARVRVAKRSVVMAESLIVRG